MKMYSGTRYASGKNFNYYKKPFYQTKGFYILLGILILIAVFVAWSIKRTDTEDEKIDQKYSDETDTPILAAKISSLIGEAETMSPNSDWVELADNYQVKSGDSVRTNASSKVIIELPDESILRLNENSEVELTQIGLADIIINQKKGEVFHRVNDKSPAIYRVKHNDVELTALGTAFNVMIKDNLTYLTVTENKVKAKVYKDDNILNMRTIDEGTEATINPSLAVDKMIDSKTVNAADLMSSSWYNWNLEQNTAKGYYLGLFAKATKLIITEPAKSEFSTDQDAVLIKGVTEPEAEIFIDGKELKNNGGNFELNYMLGTDKVNEITITVKNDKNLNKKVLKVTSTKVAEEKTDETKTEDVATTTETPEEKTDTPDPAPIKPIEPATDSSASTQGYILLSGSDEGTSATLNWLISDFTATNGVYVMMSNSANVLYPGREKVALSSGASYTWSNLTPGQKYYFRVCENLNNNCGRYSNEYSATIK